MANVNTAAVLETRRYVLRSPAPTIRKPRSARNYSPLPDPFAHESHSFYLQAPQSSSRNVSAQLEDTTGSGTKTKAIKKSIPSTAAIANSKQEDKTSASAQKQSTAKKPAPTTLNGKNGSPKKPKRFVPKWTPEMDKILHRALVKHGWGCWTLIAQSGKLPQEFTRKMISNRAKAIGLTREMINPMSTNINRQPSPAPLAPSIPPS